MDKHQVTSLHISSNPLGIYSGSTLILFFEHLSPFAWAIMVQFYGKLTDATMWIEVILKMSIVAFLHSSE